MNYFLLKIATIYAYNKSGTIKMSDYKLILIKNVIFIFVIQSKGGVEVFIHFSGKHIMYNFIRKETS